MSYSYKCFEQLSSLADLLVYVIFISPMEYSCVAFTSLIIKAWDFLSYIFLNSPISKELKGSAGILSS